MDISFNKDTSTHSIMSSDEEEYSHSEGEDLPLEPAPKAKKARRKRRKKDPSKPRGRLSAYMYFGQTLRPALKQQHPEAGVTDLAKMIGAKWRELSDGEKTPYQQLAEQDKERYSREMANYTPTPGYEKKKKKPDRDPLLPKKPMSAYFLYGQVRRPELKAEHPEFKLGDLAKQMGEEWRNMSDERKKPYQDEAVELKEQYHRDMAIYKANQH